MQYPNIQVPNFFSQPDRVVDYAKTLEYHTDDTGQWPGKRSPALHTVDYTLYTLAARKVLAALYPMNYHNINWEGFGYFQRFPKGQAHGEGWIHQDISSQFTAIVYLSHHNNCGTNLYIPKDELKVPLYYEGSQSHAANEIKKEYYSKNKPLNKKYFDALKINNSNFTKTVGFNSVYNSLVVFDGHTWHNANSFSGPDCKEERLFMVLFFQEITSTKTMKYSGVELLKV